MCQYQFMRNLNKTEIFMFINNKQHESCATKTKTKVAIKANFLKKQQQNNVQTF